MNQVSPIRRAAREGYWHRVAVALDQLLNVSTFGDPDETISSRSARAAARGDLWGRIMLAWLDYIQPNHGQRAEEADLGRAEIVEHLEESALGEK